MGSIVYILNSETESIDLKEFVIIDRQQRLTTIILFIKIIHFSKINFWNIKI